MQVKLIIVFTRSCLAPFLLVPSFVENSSELDLGDIFYGDHIFGDIWEIIKVSDDKIGRAIYPRYPDSQLPSTPPPTEGLGQTKPIKYLTLFNKA